MEILHPNYGLSISKEETGTEDIMSNPLPRAVLRPNSYALLDGEWKFTIDLEDRGLQEQWFLGHEYENKANWPGSIEQHMSTAKGQLAGKSWQDKVVAWYEREFQLPERKVKDVPPRTMLQLTFGACGYQTQVWLNGTPLRTIEGNDVHVGEYTSFSYELNEENL